MKLCRESLLKNTWHDSRNNILMFSDKPVLALGINIQEGQLLLCVDGSECCEGMFEQTDGTKDDILSILSSYGYTEMAEVFKKRLCQE